MSPSTIFSLIPSFWEFGSLFGITPWGVLITVNPFNIVSSAAAKLDGLTYSGYGIVKLLSVTLPISFELE